MPGGSKWSDLDNTCVSSTGIANDPKGKSYSFGGEINTAPTNSPEEQVSLITDINDYLCKKGPAPIVNYRSNLHIHIRVPGLKDDLPMLKQLLTFINTHQQEAFDIVETIPTPNKELELVSAERYSWEKKRQNRRKVSHQAKLPETRVKEMLLAATPHEFFIHHAHKDAKGNPAWFQCPRAGINMRQLFEETNTIEFRHFPGTLNPQEMLSAIKWCHDFLDLAINNPETSPKSLLSTNNYTFPDFQPYEFETEQVYQFTSFDKNSRKEVDRKLSALRKVIDIDNMETSSVDVYKFVKEMV
jgi:hypothetical protein